MDRPLRLYLSPAFGITWGTGGLALLTGGIRSRGGAPVAPAPLPGRFRPVRRGIHHIGERLGMGWGPAAAGVYRLRLILRPAAICLMPQRGYDLQPNVARRRRATLGLNGTMTMVNPNGVTPAATPCRNPVGVGINILAMRPRVAARTRQPWAEGRNPFGVNGASLVRLRQTSLRPGPGPSVFQADCSDRQICANLCQSVD